MTLPWLLILTVIGPGGQLSLATGQFETEGLCRQAAAQYVTDADALAVTSCVPATEEAERDQ